VATGGFRGGAKGPPFPPRCQDPYYGVFANSAQKLPAGSSEGFCYILTDRYWILNNNRHCNDRRFITLQKAIKSPGPRWGAHVTVSDPLVGWGGDTPLWGGVSPPL